MAHAPVPCARAHARARAAAARDHPEAARITSYNVCYTKFLRFATVCICLAFSAFYELIEWWAALALGQGAHEFLGTQGDEWDTQWDMFLALTGASASLLLLSGAHDRQLDRLAQ